MNIVYRRKIKKKKKKKKANGVRFIKIPLYIISLLVNVSKNIAIMRLQN